MSTPVRPTVQVDNLIGPDHLRSSLERDVRSGLASTPLSIPPKWFYDERGSQLFDQITRLPEYYPTEAERRALRAAADEIAELTGADTVVELGSSSSDKTTTILDAVTRAGRLERYLPFDVSESALRSAADSLRDRYPDVEIAATVGDFDQHLARIPRGGRRLVVFLGGTLGNYRPEQRHALLSDIHDTLDPGDHLLVGTDLVKDVDRLVAAYDDQLGVTAEFNRNVLCVLNRELGADFDPESFDHVARWNPEGEWIEMWLRSTIDQTVTIRDLSLQHRFPADECILTEISAKFRPEGIRSELVQVGFEPISSWTDGHGDYAITLAARSAGSDR
jgi:L-histidine N-alpha-methyltransferase